MQAVLSTPLTMKSLQFRISGFGSFAFMASGSEACSSGETRAQSEKRYKVKPEIPKHPTTVSLAICLKESF